MPYLANVQRSKANLNFENFREMRFEAGELDRYGLKRRHRHVRRWRTRTMRHLSEGSFPSMMDQKALHRIGLTFLKGRFLFYKLSEEGKERRTFGPLYRLYNQAFASRETG